MSTPRRFYGKYRATVTGNIDPMQMGRVQVIVADVSGTAPTTWAMPAMPATGQGMGIYALPAVGAGVWVEFEQGDPDFPIWSGGFWGSSSELPSDALAGNPASPSVVIRTLGETTLLISDLPGPTGGIVLRSASGSASITVNDTGIFITNGQGASITLSGSSVSINDGALAVT
jgi:uncharacterized protein involved in type VI secretion and phage assembly